jgi:hypothetical protein
MAGPRHVRLHEYTATDYKSGTSRSIGRWLGVLGKLTSKQRRDEVVYRLLRSGICWLLHSFCSPNHELHLREDTLGYDPALEVVRVYNRQWPTAIAVSSTGRKFSSYPGGLDILNTKNGINGVYQVAELTSFDGETAYPNASYNSPSGGAVDYTVVPPATKGLSNYLLGVQAVYIDYEDTLWILDTVRVQSIANSLPCCQHLRAGQN